MKAKIWNFRKWITETDPDTLEHIFDNMVLSAGFTVIDTQKHYFVPYGFTKLYMLAESHFAIHTFPEEEKTYIELSSCNGEKYQAFVNMVGRYEEGRMGGKDKGIM